LSSITLEVQFAGCGDVDTCDHAFFEVHGGHDQRVEVRTTEEIERILARELDKTQLEASDREAILSLAGEELIRECFDQHGHIDSPLLLTSDFIFRRPGVERGLLKQAGLLTEPA
jgi:hypothetical protein